MLLAMSKKKPSTEHEPEPVEKKRTLRSHRWNPDLLIAADNYAKAQEVEPSEISILEKAVELFLRDRGFWPLKESK